MIKFIISYALLTAFVGLLLVVVKTYNEQGKINTKLAKSILIGASVLGVSSLILFSFVILF